MSANGISHLTYKRQRQEAKLKLAAEKRAATGKRATLKKGNMPTLYTPSNNDSGKLKQITTGTLKTGRPWN
ncbi:MAG: hypothetical protein CBC91_03755 [Rickettsiales bacterium TMED131]|nr:MAG: hypothetical protein CBC91_03755 [Rickettsiales bacterium TMED131]|tara:strand:- start:757 stop:969 length:213 start_codon:yes stop_codon:yes gene_type:complete